MTSNVVWLLDPRQARLGGARLRWKRFRRWTADSPTACEFCATAFTEGGTPGLVSGYSVVGGGPAGQDDYAWICAICYESLREFMGWSVLDTLDRPIEPLGLWEAAFGFAPADEIPIG
jgi:hypothetical protein